MDGVTLVVLCSGGWCGSGSLVRNGAKFLKFVLKSNFIRGHNFNKKYYFVGVTKIVLHFETPKHCSWNKQTYRFNIIGRTIVL